MLSRRFPQFSLILAIGGLLFTAGCEPTTKEDPHQHEEGAEHTKAKAAGQSHEGWWCNEHGIPEGVCTRCNASLASDFKKQGDWCEEHTRPESHCFLCNPDLQVQFAADYKAKEGKDPPVITDP